MGKFCPVAVRAEFQGPVRWEGLVGFLRALRAACLMAMVVVTAALMGFFGFLIMRVTMLQLTTLFTDLSDEGLLRHHQGARVPGHSLRVARRRLAVSVPKDKVTRLRMWLAERAALGRRGRLRDLRQVRRARHHHFRSERQSPARLEGELARTIRSHRPGLGRPRPPRVSGAAAVPARAPEPSASIVLRVRGELEQPQVRAIRHLVASAVSG